MSRRELLRIDARVEIEFKSFDHFHREYTKNISKGGIFIKTDKVFKPQTVIEIVLKLPNRESPLSIVGEVVHTIDQEMAEARGWEPGMGLHLVDFEEGSHQSLEEYVDQFLKKDLTPKPHDRRKHQRTAIRLRVKFPSLEVLKYDYSEDISHGGIFIQTQKPRDVGDQFIVTLVHPESGHELELRGEVARVTRQDPKLQDSISGMGIRFVEMDEEKKNGINEFLNWVSANGKIQQ